MMGVMQFITHTSVFIGNPLAQEIMSLYQEPDGTRRLLNYLLDNLAGTKRGESALTQLRRSCASTEEFLFSCELLRAD